MKKVLLIVLCCVMAISLIGCDMQNDETFETESKTENSAVENNTTVDNDTTNNETTKEETAVIDMGEDKESFVTTYMEYMTFDIACDSFATDVVIATYEGHGPSVQGFSEYRFSVKERILGNAPSDLNVYAEVAMIYVEHPSVGYYQANGLFLTPGTDYLLVLTHEVSVYYEKDIYLFLCNIIIDVSEIADSKMFGQSIIPHSPNFDFSTADLDSTVEYIKELAKDNYSPTALEANPDINTVVSSSEDVVVVKVGECVDTRVTAFRKLGYYLCTVSETLKGEASTEETIIVIFNLDEVEPGETVIVALEHFMTHKNCDWYQLSSKNSVISVDEKEKVIAAIEAE